MDQAPGCGGPGCNSGSPPNARSLVNSKVMVVAVVVLFAVVMFVLCLHIYAKWFWRNRGVSVLASDGTIRTVSWRRRRNGGGPRVQGGAATFAAQSGLERAVVEALPTFEYAKREMKQGLECAVCLEEFEEGEKGRTLPRCGHGFHLDCIDMWLHSHSTCPLCRTSVGLDEDEKQADAVVVVEVQEPPRAGDADGAVVGDVGAPFMAAMRASRRQQRSRGQLPSVSGATGVNSLPRTAEDHGEGDHGQMEESASTTAGDRDLAATALQQSLKEYEAPAQVSTEATSEPSNRAPFQVTIDIPRAGAVVGGNSASNFANALSPMARASASFRRLLSRGKNVVTPRSPDEEADEGGPSSPYASLPRPPPSV